MCGLTHTLCMDGLIHFGLWFIHDAWMGWDGMGTRVHQTTLGLHEKILVLPTQHLIFSTGIAREKRVSHSPPIAD